MEGLHGEGSNALVHPWPPKMSEMTMKSGNQVYSFVESRATQAARALIQKNAAVKRPVHTEMCKLLEEWPHVLVVGRPAIRHHFHAANPQLVVTAASLVHHELH